MATGTSSAGIARGLGYVDGENISRDEMLAAVKRIVDAVDVPVTADVESAPDARALQRAPTTAAPTRTALSPRSGAPSTTPIR